MKRSPIKPLEVPNYTLEEATRYLHVPYSTLHYWIIGERGAAPLTTIFSRTPQVLLSFKNLVEVFVLETLRQIHDVGLHRIRRSVEELRREMPSKYPLADCDLSTVGRTIFLEESGKQLINLTAGGQHAFWDVLQPFLKRVERTPKGIARRLFPFTRSEHLKAPENAPRYVVIDPHVSFGMPVLVESRISTAFLFSRYRGGASIPKLAADYGRSEAEIEEAVTLERAKAA